MNSKMKIENNRKQPINVINESTNEHTRILLLLALAMIGTMTTWFSMTAVLPEISREWGISSAQGSLITVMVQIGFVVGSLISAFMNTADRIKPSIFFFMLPLQLEA